MFCMLSLGRPGCLVDIGFGFTVLNFDFFGRVVILGRLS